MKKMLIFLLLLIPLFVLGTVIRVPFQYPKIQYAINAASNGDTVLVSNGVYSGNGNTNLIFYGKSIHLKSVNGYEHTYINGNNSTRCVNFIYGEGNDTVIEGFTIENGYDANYAGGIYCENSSPTIVGNFIYNCIGGNIGAGITLSNSNAILYGNVIASNQVPQESGGTKPLGYGGALAIFNNSSVSMYYNLIINNYADIGGAIYVDDQSYVSIINSTICNNKSIISSGGILLKTNSDIYLNTSILYGNEGGNTEQLSLLTGSTSTVIYSDVESGYSGTGNISSDPQFVNPTAGAGSTYNIFDSDWHLMASSLCIDQGDSTLTYDDDNTIRDMGILYYPHEADFSYDSSFGYTPHTITFVDESIGEASQWYWDFDNDGIWDSYEQRPTYTYTNPGVYTVTLKIENNSWESIKTKENIIVIQQNHLAKPENIQISVNSNMANLSWDAVTNANYYLIYASGNPYGEYVYVDTTESNNYTTGDISAYNRLFFKVIGFDGSRDELKRYIENNMVLDLKK